MFLANRLRGAGARGPRVRAISEYRANAVSRQHVVSMPSFAAGDVLLVLIAGFSSNPTFQTPSGYTQRAAFTGSLFAGKWSVFSKVASGSEGGTLTLSYTGSNTNDSQAVSILSIGKANGDVSVGSMVEALSSNTIDPPSVSPGWAEPTLWLPVGFSGPAGLPYLSGPSGYDPVSDLTNASFGVFARTRKSASENPGIITRTGSQDFRATTIAVRGA
jgi:hypothetical protein